MASRWSFGPTVGRYAAGAFLIVHRTVSFSLQPAYVRLCFLDHRLEKRDHLWIVSQLDHSTGAPYAIAHSSYDFLVHRLARTCFIHDSFATSTGCPQWIES
jgi:hypothetical protein